MVLHAEEAGLDRGQGDDSVVSLRSVKSLGTLVYFALYTWCGASHPRNA